MVREHESANTSGFLSNRVNSLINAVGAGHCLDSKYVLGSKQLCCLAVLQPE